MAKYEVQIDGKTVWSEDREPGSKFPDEYRGRPESGEVHLIVDGEIIGVQKPMSTKEAKAFVAGPAAIVGEMNVTLPNDEMGA